jgi:hypothetical protein
MERDNRSPSEGAAIHPTLAKASRQWPTPYGVSGNHGPDGNEFSSAVRQWATPSVRDWKSDDASQSPEHSPPLGRQVLRETGEASQFPTPTSSRRHGLQSHGRNVVAARLNPAFVEWLMGWPRGWSACAPLATASYPSWLRLHSALLLSGL